MTRQILQWGEARKFRGNTTPYNQAMKYLEEFAEFQNAFAIDDHSEMEDAIGDMYVVACMCYLSMVSDKPKFEYEQAKGLAGELEIEVGKALLATSPERYMVAMVGAEKFIMDTVMVIAANRKQPVMTRVACRKLIAIPAIIADMVGLDFDECMDKAYKAIEYRKGEWRGGVFVKEADL